MSDQCRKVVLGINQLLWVKETASDTYLERVIEMKVSGVILR